jgi:hypothetical protein
MMIAPFKPGVDCFLLVPHGGYKSEQLEMFNANF